MTFTWADVQEGQIADNAAINGLGNTVENHDTLLTGTIPPILSLLTQIRMKSADQSVTNSTVPINDNDFVFTLAANGLWILTSALFVTGQDGNNLGEINCRFSMPTGCSIDWGIRTPTWALASGQIGDGNWGAARDTSSPTVGGVLGTSIAPTNTMIVAGIENGSTAGTLQFQWAQNVANATASTIRRRSWMRLERIA